MFNIYHLISLCILASSINLIPIERPLKLNRNVKIPQVMLRIFKTWSMKDNYEPKMIRSIQAQVTLVDDQTLLMTTPFPDSMHTTIQKVELWMEFRDVKKPLKLRRIRYGAIITPVSDTFARYTHITKKPENRDNQLEINFNVTEFYVEGKENGRNYFELKVHLYPVSADVKEDDDLTKYPIDAFILLHELKKDDSSILLDMAKFSKSFAPENEVFPVKRYKRATNEKIQQNRNNSYCGLRQRYVTFDGIAGNSIIAPVGYDANRCDGICSFPLENHMSPTNPTVAKATIKNHIHERPADSCCVPKDTASLTILSLEDNSIVSMKKYADMVVSNCVCLQNHGN